MIHWGCKSCHHEWDAGTAKCDWCGGEGEKLGETSWKGIMNLAKWMVKRNEPAPPKNKQH